MLTAIEIWYNNFVKGGESVRDHDAFERMATVIQDGNCPG